MDKKKLKKINDAMLGTGQFTDTDVTSNGEGKHVRAYSQLQSEMYKYRRKRKHET